MNICQSLLFLFGTLAAHADPHSIHTLGQAVCTNAGAEQRIAMRSFGEKSVPCDVIVKKSEDKFKKLQLVVDSKKDLAICSDKFSGYQKTLADQGFTCKVSIDPGGAGKKKDVKLETKPVAKPEPTKPEPQPVMKPEAKTEVAPVQKPDLKPAPHVNTAPMPLAGPTATPSAPTPSPTKPKVGVKEILPPPPPPPLAPASKHKPVPAAPPLPPSK